MRVSESVKAPDVLWKHTIRRGRLRTVHAFHRLKLRPCQLDRDWPGMLRAAKP
jgi:hypothetical protein